MKILVLAGGGGTRLWPLSRQDFPKQFLHFSDGLSLLQKTVKRFVSAPFAEEVVVVTSAQYRSLVEQQLAKIDPNKVITVLVEPERKNTTAAIGLGVRYLQEYKNAANDSAILVIPSDQLIEPESVFLRFLEETESCVKSDRIVLFGIRPNRAETGYGYIQIGDKDEGLLYRVKRFVEKPNRKTAEQYLASGDYYWNAGIFAFSPQTFWNEVQTYSPEIYEKLKGDLSSCFSRFSELPDVSIDYAILEKTTKVVVCPLPISWSDIGCWDSVYEIMGKDENQNVKVGNVLDIDTKNSLIFGGRKLISTIGLDDLLIVETEDATFISKKGESQKVKQLVQELSKAGRKEASYQRQDWGKVRLLVSEAGFRVSVYEIVPKGSTEISCNGPTQWTALQGSAVISGKALKKQGQLLDRGPATISNGSDEVAELLLVEFLD